ncbi:hypothetical protein ACH5RR_027437 [Cinchona calisaya]|uniref:Coatomer alpha subunit n=1 Tax=Cinchona calisaya TaxID=153742 RepID=A0ABD2Z8R2_9GENT
MSFGDDCKIKIWSYEYGRCLFSLLGHLDHIRTVQFHHELPWIVSASDDRKAKIWNWQSRTCILVCSSHEDSVTFAFFHPNKDLLMSTSLDNNVRIWDISFLTPRKTAVGHEKGFIVMKLGRERLALSVSSNALLYLKDTIPTEDAALISNRVGDSYELYIVSKDRCGRGENNVQEAAKRGIGGSAVFVAPNMFAVLEKSSNQLLIKNLKNEIVNKGVLPIEIADINAIFYAGNGTLFCRAAKDRVFIFHLRWWLVLVECHFKCAYQGTKNVGKLSFLYLITGNLCKLSKMRQIVEAKNDVMAQFHNALCLGDIQERVKILTNAGHLPLAYITASVHGIHDVGEHLAAELGDNVPSFPRGSLLLC